MNETHFGYQKVSPQEKTARVGAVFDSVADRYDLMNDLMSFGVHRLWKRAAVQLAALRPGEQVLDLAGGTGDLARLMAPRVGRHGRVVVSDINAAMLGVGRDRLLDSGLSAQTQLGFAQADAEQLPFDDNTFDCVTIAFGLRNVTAKENALAAMLRVLKPGGRALILEFSRPAIPGLKPLYDAYSFTLLPTLGKLVTGDADSYRYLAESIRVHPDQRTLCDMLTEAGFERCDYYNMSGGIVAIHRGYKF